MIAAALLTPEEFDRHVAARVGGGEIFTAGQVAILDGIKTKTVQNAVSAGDLKSVGTGRLRRFKKWDVYEWMLNRHARRDS